MSNVIGVVLAAGAGRRFGGPKALAILAGRRLVDRATETLTAGGCGAVVVVAGAVSLSVEGATVIEPTLSSSAPPSTGERRTALARDLVRRRSG